MKPIVYERLQRIDYDRREFHPVGETIEEMRETMEWVRSLGHEAASLEADGFRYRSIYPGGNDHSRWMWAEPGQWLMHMAGDRQDPELDMPHDHGPEDNNHYTFGLGAGDWHQVDATPDA